MTQDELNKRAIKHLSDFVKQIEDGEQQASNIELIKYRNAGFELRVVIYPTIFSRGKE